MSDATSTAEHRKDQAGGLNSFVKFLRGYMGLMPLVVAAFAPVAALTEVVPVYAQQKKLLAAYSGLLGFLIVTIVFYARHDLAKYLLTAGKRASLRALIRLTPLVFILTSVFCFKQYLTQLKLSAHVNRILMTNSQLERAYQTVTDTCREGEQAYQMVVHNDLAAAVKDESNVQKIQDWMQSFRGKLGGLKGTCEGFPALRLVPDDLVPQLQKLTTILAATDLDYISDADLLTVEYLGIFAFAELAFVFMAMREYMLLLLGISEQSLVFEENRKSG
jgi:hypothetical protein